MTFAIDTGFLVFITTHLLFGVLWLLSQAKPTPAVGVTTYSLSRLLSIVGWVLVAFRDQIFTPVAIILIAAAFLFATALQIATLFHVKRNATMLSLGRLLLVATIATALVSIACLICTRDSARFSVLLIGIVLLWVYPLISLITEKNAAFQHLMVILGIICLIPLTCTIVLGFLDDSQPFLLHDPLTYLALHVLILLPNLFIIMMSGQQTKGGDAHAATYDDLTGVYNRRTFLSFTDDLIRVCARRESPLTFMILDLDQFRKINEVYGNYFGDQVLKNLAETVSRGLRKSDLFGRLGADQFTVVLPDTGEFASVKIAERIRAAIERSVVQDAIQYTVSIGLVNLVPTEETTTDLLYRKSEHCLHLAKKKGRNRVELTSE